MDRLLKEKLQIASGGSVLFDESLARYSSFAIGGPADALVVINKREELKAILNCSLEEKVPWRVIGKGSNLLIRDDGFRGLVIILGEKFAQIEDAVEDDKQSEVQLNVGAGCSLTKLNHYCSRKGYGGLTFSYGIPGSVGGAVVMNAGAWGKEMASVVTEVELITATGEKIIHGQELDFTYRRWPHFELHKGEAIITRVTFHLESKESELLTREMKQLLQKRKAVQPHNYPNGGSCFKNPAGKSAGQIIEECGLKGESVGGAMVSQKHANFIVNVNKATAEDVLSLLKKVRETVWNRVGINLEPELHIM